MVLLLSLGSILTTMNFMQTMLTVCVCLPFSLGTLYKTLYYTEDVGMSFTSLGVMLTFLTLSLLVVILLASSESKQNYYVFMHVILTGTLIMCFLTNNLLSFYIYFEACLIPILLMIIHWGYQPERLQASTYMVLYTIISSLPLLVVVIYQYMYMVTYHMFTLQLFGYKNSVLLLLGLLAFMVKLPVYGLHVWLPKAHVEAPLGGSMILAGVLLKLGGYGMYLYGSLINFNWNSSLSMFIMLISLWGGVLASLVCMAQSDIKALIAYSSIVHMSLVTMGLLSSSSWGLYSASVIMMAHGWASSALFLLSYITYQFVGSRSFSYTKGLLMVMPILSFSWFIFIMINMSFPPTMNFMGEIFMVPVSFMYSWKVFMPVGLLMFMSVAYNMYLYTQTNHGNLSNYITMGKGLSSRILLAVYGHLLPMLLILKMCLFN